MISKFVAAMAVGLVVVVSAYVGAASIDGAVAQSERSYSCYWLSNRGGEGWVRMPQLRSEQQCFEMDSCDGGLGYSGGGCYKWSTAADAPGRRWTIGQRRAEQFQCYWLSNTGEGWVAMPEFSSEQACFEMDSCDDGLGYSGGGCYMWSSDPSGPRRPWSNRPPPKR